MLAIPKLMGHTKQARFTKFVTNSVELENASERYYLDYEDWPRLSDTPYTAEQIEEFAQKIYDKTGQIVTLDATGSYYDIDYFKLQPYIHVPDNKEYYVLQNPVGNVYFLEGLSDNGKSRTEPPVEDNYDWGDYITTDNADGTISIIDYVGTNTDLAIPSIIRGKLVTRIENESFKSKGLASIIIPDSVVSIGNHAFLNNNITLLTIGNGVQTMGASAFASNKLTTVTIPISVTNLSGSAFYDNQLTKITIGPNVSLLDSTISAYFNNAYNSTMKQAGTYNAMTQLGIWTKENIGEGYITTNNVDGTIIIINYIGVSTDISIPTVINGKLVTRIENDAFISKNLTSVIIPDSVTSIGNHAFLSNKLVSITIGSNVKTMGASAFASNKLTTVTIPLSLTTISGSAFSNNLLTSVTIGTNVSIVDSTISTAFNTVYKNASKIASTYISMTQAGILTKQ